MSENGNGCRYHYACSGRQKNGPKACDGERLPHEKIQCAVIGQLSALYRDEHVKVGRTERCANHVVAAEPLSL
jgi:hypothetical protein